MPGVNFDRVRAEISMEQVLQLLGFSPARCRGDQWYGHCPLPGCSRDSKAVFLGQRGDGPVLLSPLPPPRPPARTLGSGYWLIPAPSGYRPLRRLGPRSTLDWPPVIRLRASLAPNDEPTACHASTTVTEKRPSVLAPPHHATVPPLMI